MTEGREIAGKYNYVTKLYINIEENDKSRYPRTIICGIYLVERNKGEPGCLLTFVERGDFNYFSKWFKKKL